MSAVPHPDSASLHLLPPVRAITFDLDDTLWAVWPAIEHAERELRAWLDAHCPDMAATHDRAAMLEIRAGIVATTPRLVHDVSELRRRVLRAALLRTGYSVRRAKRLAHEAFEVFLDARHAVEYHEHAAPVLAELGQRYLIGALTNGNADVYRLDIGPLFHFSIQAGDVGSSKPEPAMFLEAMRRTGFGADEFIHVGDDPENDVTGAMRLGWRTVWVNRAREPWPLATAAADEEVACLSELPRAIARLDTRDLRSG